MRVCAALYVRRDYKSEEEREKEGGREKDCRSLLVCMCTRKKDNHMGIGRRECDF